VPNGTILDVELDFSSAPFVVKSVKEIDVCSRGNDVTPPAAVAAACAAACAASGGASPPPSMASSGPAPSWGSPRSSGAVSARAAALDKLTGKQPAKLKTQSA